MKKEWNQKWGGRKFLCLALKVKKQIAWWCSIRGNVVIPKQVQENEF